MSYLRQGRLELDVYVDACVIHGKGVGIGVYCPQNSAINCAEAAPRNLVGLDINLAELFAIIRGMERAESYTNHLVLYSDSANAVSVARDGNWSAHYAKLKPRFNAILAKYQSVKIKQVDGSGDYHGKADQFARQGAENY